MYCPNCKREFDGKFCPECGTKLVERTTRICPNCNIEVESKFCPECGAKIVEMAVKTTVTGEIATADSNKKSEKKKSSKTANAVENDVVACYNTAMEYHLGINGKKTDGKKATEWYQRAAEMGLAEAQVQLAGCYRRGWGVESDIDLAFEWYHKAAEQGNGWAQYALGNLYGNSLKGHPRDEKEMQKWYKKAFAQGIRELPGLPEPLSPEAMAKAAELQAAGTKVTVEKKNNKPTETKNMEEKKTFKVEVSVYGSYGMEAGWVDTEEYDVDTMTKNQCSGIYRECNFSAGFAPGLGMQFELAVYDEQGEKVFTSERMEDFPFVETIEDLKKIKFFKSNAKEVFEECEKRKRKDLSFVSTGIYVISLCEKKWMIYEFKIEDDDFHPEKLFFWPDFSAGMLAGTRLTNPYNIFYDTRFAKAWDITDREDSFGYTLSLQEVDEDGNWTMLNSFNQDDEDEDWNDDENEDWNDDENEDWEDDEDEDWEDDEDEDEVIITEIEMEAFYDSEDKKSITIPDSVTNIESGVFANNSGLTSIVVADGNTVYDSRDNCNAIIETATNTLFAGCQSTVIPNSVTSIGNAAFNECSNLTNIVIPNSVTSFGSGAFRGCTGLTSIEIPNSVTSFGIGAFNGCTGLTSIEIPNSVTRIGIGAFRDCTGLTSIEIPNSVTHIGTKAFWGCTNLKSIKVPAGKGDYFKELLDNNELAKIVVEGEGEAKNNNKDNYEVKDGVGFIPAGTTEIKEEAFKGREDLRSINIPKGVTRISFNAFEDCINLTSITIPDSVTTICDDAINGCTSLESITLPCNLKCISDGLFYKCESLKDITIPNSVIWINYTAFGECISLTSITIPSSVTRIETAAFWGCKNLKSITILNANAYVSFDVFEECSSLEEIRVPAGSTDRFKDLFYDDELKKLIVEI